MEQNNVLMAPCKYDDQKNFDYLIGELSHTWEDSFIEIEFARNICYQLKTRGMLWLIGEMYNRYPTDSIQIRTLRELIDKYIIFPIQGDEYSLALNAHTDYLDDFLTDPHEVKAALFKSSEHSSLYNLHMLPRYKTELNPTYVQIVVGGLVTNLAEDKICLLKVISSDFAGKYKLVQCHASYDRSIMNWLGTGDSVREDTDKVLYEYYKKQVTKKLTEELSLDKAIVEKYGLGESIVYVPRLSKELTNLSYYHIGMIFSLKLPDEILRNLGARKSEQHTYGIFGVDKVSEQYTCEVVGLDKVKEIVENKLSDDWLKYILYQKYSDRIAFNIPK